MNDKLKKLTGKNPKDFEPAAFDIINNSDETLFSELVSQDGFLFDFIKQNVAQRLSKVCNEKNYLNLLNFLKYYSPSYEDFIVSTLARYADEDLTDKMLEIFEKGSDDEKTYCAKFFSYIQDPLAIELLKKYAWSETPSLSANCASTLAKFGDVEVYKKALEMLNSNDEFNKLDGVKFLCAYGNKDAIPYIIEAIKTSSMPENIAGEVLYLIDLFSLYEQNKTDALIVLNSVINGLGEILPLESVFDFELYNFLEMLCGETQNSQVSIVLYNAIDKFNTLTENDEYLFDESKETKQEVFDIKQLLEQNRKILHLTNNELNSESPFVFTALEFTNDSQKVRELLHSTNPAIVVKSLEVLKQLDKITTNDKQIAMNSINDENIKAIVEAI